MAKPKKKAQKLPDAREYALRAMTMCNFNNQRRLEWMIWAAKDHICPRCGVPAFEACENLTERKGGQKVPTRWPHADRIDWIRMVRGLRQRGYCE